MSMSTNMLIYARVHDEFGNLIQLILSTLFSIRHFILFFIIWLVLFSFLIQISGSEIASKEEYKRLPNFMYFIYTYRNSIGDIDVVDYDFWDLTSYRLYNFSMLMIYVIYFIWFVQ